MVKDLVVETSLFNVMRVPDYIFRSSKLYDMLEGIDRTFYVIDMEFQVEGN